ncbi:MAG TPA: FAD-dependent oxidoreductase [Desulfitobacteriaceae bacterium]|nr:FAD-dependent oxidoreductase [Desulfitobacteriaceae bacterium]
MSEGLRFTGKNTSVWLDTTPSTTYPSLEQELSADVVVIGGGITGLMSAFFLQRAGLKVIVLEGSRIVTGTSGYTTAKITSAHAIVYNYLIKNFGQDKAQIYADANQQSIETITALASEFNIDCDLERLPAFTYLITENDSGEVAEEVAAAQSLGLPVSFTRDLSLPYPISAAIRYENQAKFHPRKFLLEIAALIIKNGGHIFEDTLVTSIKEGNPNQIISQRGMVTAPKVVVASNLPFYDPTGFFTPMARRQSYTIGVKVDGLLPVGVYYGPETNNFHSLRTQPLSEDEDILIIGGELHHPGKIIDTIRQYELLEEWAQRYFPVKSLVYRWTTSDSECYDHVPLIGKISPKSQNIFVATGFGGWGMTHGTIAGLILADEVRGQRHPWSSLYSPARFPKYLSQHKRISIFKKWRHSIKYDDQFTDLPAGGGMVKNIRGKIVAAYRDNQNVLHAVSAICTHMGCIVVWNQFDQTWDCPCHGSRYDSKGKVIHGPALHDLAKNM